MTKIRIAIALSLVFVLGVISGALLWRRLGPQQRHASAALAPQREIEKYTLAGEIVLVSGEKERGALATVHALSAADWRGVEWFKLRRGWPRIGQLSQKPTDDSQRMAALKQALAVLVGSIDSDSTTTSDSNGKFSIRVPRGYYYIVAVGHVGDAEGVWCSEIVDLPTTKSVRLDKPLVVVTKTSTQNPK